MCENRTRYASVILALLLVLCSFCLAAEPSVPKSLPEVDMKTKTVVVFKNGLGFFLRQGTAKLMNGEGKIPFVPDATLGSLWVAPNDPGTSIEELVAFEYKVSKSRAAGSVTEMLNGNVGKTVTITIGQKEYTGEILGFADADRAAVSPSMARQNYPPFPQPQVPRLLLLKVQGNVLALDAMSIGMVSLPEQPNLTMKQTEDAKALRFKLKSSPQTANLTMGYLQNGMGWTPSYLISLQDGKTARITMQAVLVNDVEDLTDTEVFFAVGTPNFAFANRLSPMALQQSLMDFMANRPVSGGVGAGFAGGIQSNVVVFDRLQSFKVGGGVVGGVPDAGPQANLNPSFGELEGAAEEDLFLYSRPAVALAKGERGTYNVFTANVPYEDIYEWEIVDNLRFDAYGNRSYVTGSPDRMLPNNVWHSLRLKNNSKFPWTTAPAMVISGTKPISQDIMHYTSTGASTNLKMTIATDIRAEKKELETARQQRAVLASGGYFDVVTVEGSLKVKNYKNKDVVLTITRSLAGDVTSASDEGKAEKLGDVISGTNPNSRITWEITLKPGEEKALTYQYKILVRG